jgi:hypothetical protein
MTTARVIQLVRQLISDVDPETRTIDDDEILVQLSFARDTLELRKIASVTGIAIGTDSTKVGYGIVPEPTIAQGTQLALQAAIDILDSAYRGRLFRGELGTSWQSGLESESTISADKSYKEAISNLRSDLESVILVQGAATAGQRVQ